MARISTLLIAAAAASTLSGCASLSLPFVGGKAKAEVVRATEINPVMEAITLWEPGEGRGLDNLPARGFAGQVLFFTYQHPTPARVEGTITVYVFDDQGSTEEQARPMFQHSFDAQQWNALSLQTNLGTAYQLFVPYVRKGTHTAHCSLRIKFEPSDGGPPVYSKMANVVLEGPKTRVPEPQLTRRRIEPERFDQTGDMALRQVPRSETSGELKASSLSLPGRGRLSTQSAARLQQFAEQMVRAHRDSSGGVEQAAYFTPADDDQHNATFADETEASSGTSYRLYR